MVVVSIGSQARRLLDLDKQVKDEDTDSEPPHIAVGEESDRMGDFREEGRDRLMWGRAWEKGVVGEVFSNTQTYARFVWFASRCVSSAPICLSFAFPARRPRSRAARRCERRRIEQKPDAQAWLRPVAGEGSSRDASSTSRSGSS